MLKIAAEIDGLQGLYKSAVSRQTINRIVALARAHDLVDSVEVDEDEGVYVSLVWPFQFYQEASAEMVTSVAHWKKLVERIHVIHEDEYDRYIPQDVEEIKEVAANIKKGMSPLDARKAMRAKFK